MTKTNGINTLPTFLTLGPRLIPALSLPLEASSAGHALRMEKRTPDPIKEAKFMSRNPGPKAQKVNSDPPRRIAWSVAEVALQTGLSEPFVRLEIKRGNLPASKVGRRVIVLDESMLRWLEQGTWLSGSR
jgi:excisionase family DNA binding protein